MAELRWNVHIFVAPNLSLPAYVEVVFFVLFGMTSRQFCRHLAIRAIDMQIEIINGNRRLLDIYVINGTLRIDGPHLLDEDSQNNNAWYRTHGPLILTYVNTRTRRILIKEFFLDTVVYGD